MAASPVGTVLATVRSQTVSNYRGLADQSGDAADPAPGIGTDDDTPLGDTSEHSDAIYDPESAEGSYSLAMATVAGARHARVAGTRRAG